ncbi:MAG: endonuclease MutS2 [Nitrospina sp.]|nr:endonuclease MutS2 [Nitrospina sp.]
MTQSVYSLSDNRNYLLEKSRDLLGWPLIKETLAGYACSPVTSELCRSLVPHSDRNSANNALDTTAEMVEFLARENAFPINSFENFLPILEEAKERDFLESVKCLSVLKLLRVIRQVRNSIEKQDSFPLLKSVSNPLDPLPSLYRELERCIDDEGEIKDNASPELKQAARDVSSAKQKLESKVEKFFSSDGYKEAIQDNFHTEREGRLVIPVKSDKRSQIEGIVHDSSGSGQTLYIEPSAIVPLNNQLKINRLALDREKKKILQVLTRQIIDSGEMIVSSMEILVQLDFIHARARLAKVMQARLCSIGQGQKLQLNKALNPELVLNGHDVIPNDIAWDQSTHVIIISGPNTGGKTVTLKTVGLMTLMVRAGLFLPVDKGSYIPFYPEVYADIGDEQSLELSLSTFSAHIKKIIHIMNHAASGALILLDELGIATDPQEGASLAEAMLRELNDKGVTTLVSTHYMQLKLLAQTRSGFLNACTEFDSKSQAPTYRLIFGVPGHSAAIDIAEQLGLHVRITELARKIYQSHDTRAEEVLKDLTQQRVELLKEKEALQLATLKLENLTRQQLEITESLQEKEKKFILEKSKRIQSSVREAKNQVLKIIKEVKGTSDISKLHKAERKIGMLGRVPLSAYRNDLSEWRISPETLKEGDLVLIENYGEVGTLLEEPAGKKKVRVSLGKIETVIPIDRLKGNLKKLPPKDKLSKTINVNVHTESEVAIKTNCDLRGMNSDEALITMEGFLSQAIVSGIKEATIIHGHGMGKIKSIVRDYLSSTGICKKFSPAPRGRGGDGATIVEF